ncbi:CPCC family cysteine-rich protein [uncultured Allobaculum sp.]|uniref:CPCC family cysteine-rich protein n=1 Tax=uncultured Allobaculum sp. TaxID=1187017 RepID=UPI00338F14C7
MTKLRDRTLFTTQQKPIKCPVCGEEYVDKYSICSICNWENDPVQLWKPDTRGGANHMSLSEAREAWKKGEPIT